MELQFHKSMCSCLNPVTCDVRSQEQTQEVKLSDGMPDIGRVLASWGQCLLRSKEWRGSGMSVSGGVMTWTLYAPEDGSDPVCVEAWVPFHMKWDFPETQRDGVMRTVCALRSVDARSLSARRLLVRANASVWAEALEPVEREIMTDGDVPVDIQLLKQTYPLRIPREAGEKTFMLEEEMPLSSSGHTPEKLISYQLQPEILEKKVMGERIVFRGNAALHLVFWSDDGKIHSCDLEIPFSQLAELEQEYGSDCELDILPAVTSLELELGEEKILLKCGIAAQFLVRDREMVALVQDAYSPRRQVSPTVKELNLPVILDQRQENRQLEAEIQAEAEELADTVYLLEFPRLDRNGEVTEMELAGGVQVLYYDREGQLQCSSQRFEEKTEIPVSPEARLQALITDWHTPQTTITGNGIHARINFSTNQTTSSDCGMPMVVGLEAGETEEPDPHRPSLILRKAGEEPLWEVAKQCGSTVDAIRQANKLQTEPENGQILLIPIP